jgi:hypothetical protein
MWSIRSSSGLSAPVKRSKGKRQKGGLLTGHAMWSRSQPQGFPRASAILDRSQCGMAMCPEKAKRRPVPIMPSADHPPSHSPGPPGLLLRW